MRCPLKYLALLCVVICPGRPNAQAWSQVARPLDPPTVERFAQRLSNLGGPTGALQAPEGTVSSNQRRAIADTLVAIAIAENSRAPGLISMTEVVVALQLAAQSPQAATRELAITKLRELADNPSNQITSSLGVFGLSQLDDKAVALKHLREIAISRDLGAFTAVENLARYFGEEGRSALKEMVLQNLIVQPQAKKDAEGYARVYKWREK